MKFLKQGFDGFTIKILALILMTFDHIGEFMPVAMDVPVWFHWIGRLVAPLFIFMAVEGFCHTHNRKKYMSRLYIWSVIMALGNSTLEKMMPHPNELSIINNIFATLFLTMIYLQGIAFIQNFKKEKNSKDLIKGLALIVIPSIFGVWFLLNLSNIPLNMIRPMILLVPTLFTVEGGIAWIGLGIILYLCRGKKIALSIAYILFCIFIFVTGAHGDYSLSNTFMVNYQWIMIASLPFMILYNGEKGKGMKYLFYLYYPLHIYILYVLGILLI